MGQTHLQFNGLGVGDFKLRDTLCKACGITPLDSSSLKDTFLVLPNSKHYYVYKNNIKLSSWAQANLLCLIISISDDHLVNKLVLYVDDTSNEIDSIAKELKGKPGWGAISNANSNNALFSHSSRITDEGAEILIYKTDRGDLLPYGANCKLQFRMLNDITALKKYSVIYLGENNNIEAF